MRLRFDKRSLRRALTIAAVLQLAIVLFAGWRASHRFPRLHLTAQLEGVSGASLFPTGLFYYDTGRGLNGNAPVRISYRTLDGRADYVLELPTWKPVKQLVFLPLGYAGKVRISDLSVERYGRAPLPSNAFRAVRDVEVVREAGEVAFVTRSKQPLVALGGIEAASRLDGAAWGRLFVRCLPWLPLTVVAGLAFATGAATALWALVRRERRVSIATLAIVGVSIAASAAWRYAYVPDNTELAGSVVLAVVASALWRDAVLAAALAGLVVGATIARGGRKGAAAVSAACGLLVLWTVAARILDFAHFHYSGRHVGLMFFRHAQGSALGLRPEGVVALAIVIGLAVVAGLVAALVSLQRAVASSAAAGREHAGMVLGLAVPPVAALLAIASVPVRPVGTLAEEQLARASDARAFPEMEIPALLLEREDTAGEVPALPQALAAKLAAYGVDVDPSKPWPLWKEHAWQGEVPFARKPGAPAKPNVMIVFLESFSSALTGLDPDAPVKDATPELVSFAKEATVIRGMHNASLPTFNGVMAALCSYMLLAHSETLYAQGAYRTRLSCLPSLLERHGYESLYQMQVEKGYLHMGPALESAGFDRVLAAEDLAGRLRQPPFAWGYSDHQVFRGVRDLLEHRELPEPFLLAFKTVDTHPPFRPPRDAVRYGDGKNPLLNAVHGADHAFGQFWRWFRGSSYASNTIVVVVGDHPVMPGAEVKALLGHEGRGRMYDELLFVLHDPTRDLPAEIDTGLSSSVDIPPTLLHLLGIDEPNAFEGRSLFDARHRDGGILGAAEEHLFVLRRTGEESLRDEWDMARHPCPPDEEIPVLASGTGGAAALSRCEYVRWHRWKRALHFADRVIP